MRGLLGFVGSWLHLSACIYVAFVLFWGVNAFLQRNEGIQISLGDTALSVATLAAMQAALSAIYILPFVPFRNQILQAKFPFVKLGYISILTWIILLLSLLWFQAEVSAVEVISDRTFWVAVLRYEFIAYLAVVIWGLSLAGWKAISARGRAG